MGHDIGAGGFRFEHDGLQLFEAVLGSVDFIAGRHGAAAGHDLDVINPLAQ